LHILLIALVVGIVLLAIDWMNWEPSQIVYTVLGVLVPLLGGIAGVILLIYSFWRRTHHMQTKQTVIAAVICFAIMLLPFVIMMIMGMVGIFPVPE
ncbi:MAG: hypothetical protein ACI4WR_11840, partial [Bulleidia sp.]